MIISDLNHLEYLFEEASVISGGKAQVKSASVKKSSGKAPQNFASSSVKTLSLTSDEHKDAITAKKILRAQDILLTSII